MDFPDGPDATPSARARSFARLGDSVTRPSGGARESVEPREVPDPREPPEARLRRLVDAHFGLVWRTLRYNGVPEATADDATQQVFCVLARRLGDVHPGTEQAFLFGTAFRVASEARRAAHRRPSGTDEGLEMLEAPLPSAEELLDRARARAALEEVLGEMPADVRTVFVLIEIEELPLAEVAQIIEAPIGTVSSRLRRARQTFEAILKRRRAAETVGRRGARK